MSNEKHCDWGGRCRKQGKPFDHKNSAGVVTEHRRLCTKHHRLARDVYLNEGDVLAPVMLGALLELPYPT